ncbi:hypothetical protein T440DRAFT_313578 [Plenodomus tracheiphilus IPT5]|uniref:Uncharacterized protein n=1 Tax=Plenodomus tracheiphilus IPT5 TaxID=1408161 RepID=A0A6A7BE11_9PLEO|nr:hypothetical protein T440DRAFT_313578 [Plenodomus tracheiphilus IPT5]
MVLLCKDERSKTGKVEFGIESVNMDTAEQISKWGSPKEHDGDVSSLSTKILRPIRMSSGRTNVETMPLEVAPLIYPGLEELIELPHANPEESFKGRSLRNKEFVGDYFDRRARASWAGNNPDSTLTKASPAISEFRHRFADPNHPCNNGHLFSLVTGGKYVARPRGRRLQLRGLGDDGKLLPKEKTKAQVRGPIDLLTYPVKRFVTPNILYLTIVNQPNEEKMAQARRTVSMERKSLSDLLSEYGTLDRTRGESE